MQKTEQKIRAALCATMAEQGVLTQYEYQFNEAIESALRDALDREIDAHNVLKFRVLEPLRKAAKEKETLEEALKLIRDTFAGMTAEDRITEALLHLNTWGASLYELERDKKITAEERAKMEKENDGAVYAYYLSEKKLSFSIGLDNTWGEGRAYCTNAREHYAHIRALFELHFKQTMPALLDFLKTEVIAAEAFSTHKDGALIVRLFKNGRLDIEGLDTGKIKEINARLAKTKRGVIIWKN